MSLSVCDTVLVSKIVYIITLIVVSNYVCAHWVLAEGLEAGLQRFVFGYVWTGDSLLISH